MTEQKLGVGIIGLGGIAFAHEAGYFEMGEVCRIVAMCDIREEEAVSRAAMYDAKAYTRYQDLLADPAVDVVDIIVPHEFHYEIAKAALEKGKHVLVEKPITVKSEQAEELIALANQKGLKFSVAENTHFVTAYLKAEEILKQGVLGDIWTICAGDPPADKPLTEYAQLLHGFWDIGEDVPAKRSQEDAACCAVLGAAAYRRYTVLDNIYRYHPGTGGPVIKENEDQFKPLEPDEAYLVPLAADFFRKNLPETCELVAPLGIGSHRDHVLTRRAAEHTGHSLWHYADYPYVVYGEHTLADWLPAEPETFSLEISPSGLKAWQDGFACQRSQIPLLFVDEEDMRASIEKYLKAGYGSTVWKF